MKILIGITAFLTVLGLLFVFEASLTEGLHTFGDQYHFVKNQGVWLAIGWVLLITASLTPTKIWRKISPILYWMGVVLLVATLLPGIGREFNGAKRWLALGSLTVIQPIEFVKFSTVTYFAQWLTKHQRLLPFLMLTGIPVGLVMVQPDLGSALLLSTICFGMYFTAGGNIGTLSALGGGMALLAVVLIISSPYRLQRVTTFINPESDPLGASFHMRQMTLALGRGGWTGQGIGNSRQKLAYLPEPSSDSIFAIVAEELGFLGSVLLISLYGGFLYAGYRIVKRQKPQSFNHILGTGILIWIGLQIILNLAAVVALVPLTGVPLPFFSYGGSSQVMILLATGVLIGLR